MCSPRQSISLMAPGTYNIVTCDPGPLMSSEELTCRQKFPYSAQRSVISIVNAQTAACIGDHGDECLFLCPRF